MINSLNSYESLPKKIYAFWGDGVWCNAPETVINCLLQWKLLNPDYDVIVLDLFDAKQIITDIPINLDKIPIQALSDILRAKILYSFGGVWVDATTFPITPLRNWLPYKLADDFFAFQILNADRPLASWFLAANPQTKIITAWWNEVTSYWSVERRLWKDPREGNPIPRYPLETITSSSKDMKHTYPYFWFHYLFLKLLNTRGDIQQSWCNRSHISAIPSHNVQRIYTNKTIPNKRDVYLVSKGTFVQKLDWRKKYDGLFSHLESACRDINEEVKMKSEEFSKDLVDLEKMFPVPSQTTLEDKKSLRQIIDLARENFNNYSYMEIGSFLGGSIAPFAIDNNCYKILSIDDRGKVQKDERGINYDYTKYSSQDMLDNLIRYNVPVSKIQCFDGSIQSYSGGGEFNIVFIDGIHTDEAVFSDFLSAIELISEKSIIIFHDFSLVYKGIRLCKLLLQHKGVPATILMNTKSEVCAFIIGDFITSKVQQSAISERKFEEACAIAEKKRISDQFRNRCYVRQNNIVKKLNIPNEVFIGDPITQSV